VGSTMFNIRNADQLSSVTQVKFDGKFEFAENARLDFGIESREMESHTVRYAAQDRALGNWDADYPGEFGDLVKPFDLHGEFDDFSPNRTNAYSFRANPVDLYEAILANPKGTNAYNGKSWDYTSFASLVMPQTSDDRVNEDMMAAYFQVELSGDVGNMPFSVLTGLRYETTDVSSTSLTAAYKTVWASDNDFSIQVDDTKPSFLKPAEASYDNLLPSLDLRLDIRDDLIARFSFGKTIARAGLGSLSTSASGFGAGGGSTVFGAQPSAAQSNPELLPLESTNFDLSLEWYYDDASYVSAGVFEKNVMNFLGEEQITMSLLDIRNPADGPRAQQALADLETLGIAATDETLHNMMVFNQFIVQDGGGYSADWIKEFGSVGYNGSDKQNMWLQAGDARNIISNADDEPYMFRTATPNNGREAKIHGAEFAIQHFFGDTGFGVLANYTIVRGDVAFDNLAAPRVSQFSLDGLSDTANLVGMYETDRFSARIAYNWRDKFINGDGRGTNNPLYVEDYSQIDINLSYDVTDAFSVSLEGINVTGEDSRTHGRISSHLMELRDLGPRYQVGARYTF
jgi:TonB-dependent receptor